MATTEVQVIGPWKPETLPADQQKKIHSITERLKERLQRTVEDIVAIGKDLHEAKETLGHGNFMSWLQAEFDMSHQSAMRFMHVAEHFSDKVDTVLNLSRRTLYELAAPNTPDQLREEVIHRLETGKLITFEELKELKNKKLSSQDTTYRAAIQKLETRIANWFTKQAHVWRQGTIRLEEEDKGELVSLKSQLGQLSLVLDALLEGKVEALETLLPKEDKIPKKPGRKPKPKDEKTEAAAPKKTGKPKAKAAVAQTKEKATAKAKTSVKPKAKPKKKPAKAKAGKE